MSAVLGWVAALLFVFSLRARRAYLPAYGCGLVGHAVGFYWVYGTVAAFGGFGVLPSATIFAGFVALGALQFLLVALVHNNLGPLFEALALRSATAVVLSELVAVRLFRWHYGHTQVAFTPFVQVAGIGGAMLVTFLMFWLAEAFVRGVVLRERRRTLLIPVALFVMALAYGASIMRTFAAPAARTQAVVLVQGNSSLGQKHDLAAARRNRLLLFSLSRKAEHENALIVWPEGSIPAYLPADLGSVREGPALPWFDDGSAFLVGAYAFDGEGQRFNAAFAVNPDGRVPRPYFKQILIPFGESMPFASYFPWLKQMNDRAGVFTAGDEVKVFTYPMRGKGGASRPLKVAPLICYEDTVPDLSRKATRKGAEVLVNITYDTWFGRSAAPGQHHLIAAFRAIENRRFLVRATNSGLSAVVDPLGKTVVQAPQFQEGTVTTTVSLLDYPSSYTNLVHDRPWWSLLAVSVTSMLVRWKRARFLGPDRPDGTTV